MDKLDDKEMFKVLICEFYNESMNPEPPIKVSDISDNLIPDRLSLSRDTLFSAYYEFVKSRTIKMIPPIQTNDNTKLSIKDLLRDRIYLQNPNDREKAEKLLDDWGNFDSPSRTIQELALAKHILEHPDFKIYIMNSESYSSVTLNFSMVHLDWETLGENFISVFIPDIVDDYSPLKSKFFSKLTHLYSLRASIDYAREIENNNFVDQLDVLRDLREFLDDPNSSKRLDIPDYVIRSITLPEFNFGLKFAISDKSVYISADDPVKAECEMGYIKSKIFHILEDIKLLEKKLTETPEEFRPETSNKIELLKKDVADLYKEYTKRSSFLGKPIDIDPCILMNDLEKQMFEATRNNNFLKIHQLLQSDYQDLNFLNSKDLLGNTVLSLALSLRNFATIFAIRSNIINIFLRENSAAIERSELFKNKYFMENFMPTLTPPEITLFFSKVNDSDFESLINEYFKYSHLSDNNVIKNTLLPAIISNKNLSIKALYIFAQKLNASYPADETDERKMIKAIVAETYNKLLQPNPLVNALDINDSLIPYGKLTRDNIVSAYTQFAKSKAIKMVPDGEINESAKLSIKDLLRNRIYVQNPNDREKIEKIIDSWGRFDSPARTMYELVLANYILQHKDFKIYFSSSDYNSLLPLEHNTPLAFGSSGLGMNYISCAPFESFSSWDAKDTFIHELMHYFEYIVFPIDQSYKDDFKLGEQLDSVIKEVEDQMNNYPSACPERDALNYLQNILKSMSLKETYTTNESIGKEFIANFAMACFRYAKDNPQTRDIIAHTFRQTLEHFDSAMLPAVLSRFNSFLSFSDGKIDGLDVPDYVSKSIMNPAFDFSLTYEITGKSLNQPPYVSPEKSKERVECEIGYLKSKIMYALKDITSFEKSLNPLDSQSSSQLKTFRKQVKDLFNEYIKKVYSINEVPDLDLCNALFEKIFPKPHSHSDVLISKMVKSKLVKCCAENNYNLFKESFILHPDLILDLPQMPNLSKFIHDSFIDTLRDLSPGSDQFTSILYLFRQENFAKMLGPTLSLDTLKDFSPGSVQYSFILLLLNKYHQPSASLEPLQEISHSVTSQENIEIYVDLNTVKKWISTQSNKVGSENQPIEIHKVSEAFNRCFPDEKFDLLHLSSEDIQKITSLIDDNIKKIKEVAQKSSTQESSKKTLNRQNTITLSDSPY